MPNNEDVASAFVRRALEAGASKEEIKAALDDAGWAKDVSAKALDTWADVNFVVPVPKAVPYLSARDAFFYLVTFAALYVVAYSLIFLLFIYVEMAFPLREVGYYEVARGHDSIRGYIASLIVAFPLYYLVSAAVDRSIKRDPVKRGSRVRRWLTYMTLFITAQIFIGDMITLIWYFLNGDFTVRFALKVLIVAAIAGSILVQYYIEMRRDEGEV